MKRNINLRLVNGTVVLEDLVDALEKGRSKERHYPDDHILDFAKEFALLGMPPGSTIDDAPMEELTLLYQVFCLTHLGDTSAWNGPGRYLGLNPILFPDRGFDPDNETGIQWLRRVIAHNEREGIKWALRRSMQEQIEKISLAEKQKLINK